MRPEPMGNSLGNSVSIARRCRRGQRGPGALPVLVHMAAGAYPIIRHKREKALSKKAVLGVGILAAAIAVAYGGSTWWAGSQVNMRSRARRISKRASAINKRESPI